MIVLDTHAALWLIAEPEGLSMKARRAIEEARALHEPLAISCVTVWEIAQLASLKRIQIAEPVPMLLEELERVFSVEPVTASAAYRASLFGEKYPRDPMDRLIGATAAVHGAALITKDDRIRKSGEVACIW